MKILACVRMPDGSVWAVPVAVVARNRAEHYAHEFGGDVERSLVEDTVPLFGDDSSAVTDWAQNNMNWSDVEKDAHLVEPPGDPDFQEGWTSGEMWVEEQEDA